MVAARPSNLRSNEPDKLCITSFSDQNIRSNPLSGAFNSFEIHFNGPSIGNAKGLQLLSANFVNPCLQLDDYSQLMFFYYSSNSAANINQTNNLQCVRLLPSFYVPPTSYTLWTKNKYINDGTELVALLNAASAAGGDDVTYNPLWVSGDLTFNFDLTTRKIIVIGNTSGHYYAPAAADDPIVTAYLAGNHITMHSISGSGTADLIQPYILNRSMNMSLGFGLSYNNVGKNWGSGSYHGCATSVGYPVAVNVYIYADSYPILFGTQNVHIYCDVIGKSGIDSYSKQNFLAVVPITSPPLFVNQYTLTSAKTPATQLGSDIHSIRFFFRNDRGDPVWFLPNMPVTLEIGFYY